ncbi:MAG UNVERIFIED_CONTAM: hypothetical protein LVQ98_07775 [Rickettsiaceae bacterium]
MLIDSQPLLVALLARSLFGEAINPVGWLGLLLGLLGILCLGLPAALLRQWWLMGPEALGERAWSHGELWMLAAAAGHGGGHGAQPLRLPPQRSGGGHRLAHAAGRPCRC